MNQNELYLTLMAIPAFLTMLLFIIGLVVVVITNNDDLLERISKALAVLITIVGVYEIAIITYVAIIQLIN